AFFRPCTAASHLIDVLCNWRVTWFAARHELLRSEFNRSEHVRNLFVSYSETLLSQVQQSVACNAMHTTEEKICRCVREVHSSGAETAGSCSSTLLQSSSCSPLLKAEGQGTLCRADYMPVTTNTGENERIRHSSAGGINL